MLGRKDFKKAPTGAGVYFFKDGRGKVLYVGKARNLRARLLSYADSKLLGPMKEKMAAEAKKIEWRELDSEIEALIEEATQIKELKPKYNVVFRDDKQYLFAAFSKEKYPRVITTHQKNNKNFEYIGPFTDAGAVKLALKNLRKAFPYCTCRERHKRPCASSEIGRCLGVCCLTWVPDTQVRKFFPDATERTKIYRQNIRALKNIFKGKKQSVLKELEKEMLGRAKKAEFEEAGRIRNQLFSLQNIFRHRLIVARELDPERAKALLLVKELLGLKKIPERIEGYDISNLQGKNAVGSMVVFQNGFPDKSSYRLFKIRFNPPAGRPDDTAMLQEVLIRRLKHGEWPLPNLFLIDGGKGQWDAAREVLELRQLKIPVVALAKREEELWTSPEQNIPLKQVSPVLLHLFQHIRNEAHRFAISFHRRVRSRAMFAE